MGQAETLHILLLYVGTWELPTGYFVLYYTSLSSLSHQKVHKYKFLTITEQIHLHLLCWCIY